jgi:hypothetical protein
MSVSAAKLRRGPAGLHYFNRDSGLNVLMDEADLPEASWDLAPRQVSIALTNACDLDCPYCYAPKIRAVLNYERVCGWLREFDRHGALGVGFGGGEPTLYPRLADLCEFATNETRLAVTFTTHGHHLSPRLLARLKGKVNFVRVSMDGIGATYERLRRKSFADFTKRVRELGSIAPLGINFVVNAETLGDLDGALAFAHTEGAREFLLLPEQPNGRRPGIERAELVQLRTWVRGHRGDIRLAVSERNADDLGACDPCAAELGLRAYAHITATARLQRSSFSTDGVDIGEAGAMDAFQQLQRG